MPINQGCQVPAINRWGLVWQHQGRTTEDRPHFTIRGDWIPRLTRMVTENCQILIQGLSDGRIMLPLGIGGSHARTNCHLSGRSGTGGAAV